MAAWQSGDVQANGIRLQYTRTGGDKPAIVLAHGVTDAGLCWSRVAEALAPEYDVVMVDARGHGRSDAPEHGDGPIEQAGDLAGVIGALGLGKPAILGHSMGAATALVLAGTYSDVPSAILLEDPPAWWTGWSMTEDTHERLAGMRERAMGLRRKTREELIAAQRTEQPEWADAELEPWADAKRRFSPRVLSVYDPGNALGVDWPAVLGRVTCPALLITSDTALGGIVTDASAAALKAMAPHLDIAHVPGAGHSIRRDQFARYIEVVREFLAAQRGVAEA